MADYESPLPAVGDLVTLDGLTGYWVVLAQLPAEDGKPAVVSCHQEISISRSRWAHRVPADVTVVASVDRAPGKAERVA